MASTTLLLELLRQFSWQEIRHHPWRNAAAVVAVMLGVALAFSVQIINASALAEFSQAVRSVNGQPDIELRASRGRMNEDIFAKLVHHEGVAVASPVLEVNALAYKKANIDATPQRVPLKIVGVDALVVAQVAPGLLPKPDAAARYLSLFAPAQLFVNPTASERLMSSFDSTIVIEGANVVAHTNIGGSISLSGAPVAVMDIGAAQELFNLQGQLSRIDVRFKPGVDRASFIESLQLPPDVIASEPGDSAQRVSNLSRAYRVNLTALALIALFTGAFLVFSVLSLSVARRAKQFALLGVLGLTSRQRLAIVLLESGLLGLAGSVAGVALGTGLAALALRVLGGDLGGGYFAGVSPSLQWDTTAAVGYAVVGVVVSVVGGWWPARAAALLAPAQTLKGFGGNARTSKWRWASVVLMLGGVLLALAPPVFGLPIAAYASVVLLLIGGITALPVLIALMYGRLAPLVSQKPLPMLAVERARRMRDTAAIAVSGVVASLSLAVALTVMVSSFRESVNTWLSAVLPADVYLRVNASSDTITFDNAFVEAIGKLNGVTRTGTLKSSSLNLSNDKPPVTMISRQIEGDPAKRLPLVGDYRPAHSGTIPIYVSEAMVDLYGLKAGGYADALQSQFRTDRKFFVSGVWRDYVRQFGAIAIDSRDYIALTQDTGLSEIEIWLAPGTNLGELQNEIRSLARRSNSSSALADLIEFSSTADIRATSLRIFDRSFAVTYWLQAIAIGIGLFGVAASFSAQVLARRKEFGLLAHLGLTRRQILLVVAGEGAAWTVVGSVAGLLLGLAVSVVLVHVVNPQSFHWTMELETPWWRLTALCAAVIAAGTVTAWLAGRAASGDDAVLAVKEDW